MNKISIVVPTYQERENLEPLTGQIHDILRERDYEIVVVDDDSPDGTAEAARVLAERYPIRVIRRQGIRGLGSAILRGFEEGEGDLIGVIDADLQHPPQVLDGLVKAIEHGADIAVASRYARGGGIDEWPRWRKIISRGATLLARPLTKVRDPMSGCFLLRREVVKSARFDARGYKLLLEILVKAKYKTATEVPYIFQSRHRGKSKLGWREYGRYLSLLVRLYLYRVNPFRVDASQPEGRSKAAS